MLNYSPYFLIGIILNPKISIVMPSLCGGGVEKLHLLLANDWISRGFDVELILLFSQGELISLVSSSIAVKFLNVTRFRDSLLPLSRHIKLSSPQIVIAAMWPLTSLTSWACMLADFKGKIYLSEHENLKYATNKRIFNIINVMPLTIRLSYFRCDGIVAVSEGVKESLRKIGRIKPSRIQVIYNPVVVKERPTIQCQNHFDNQWANDYKYRILSVGRLVPQKDHENLIKAFYLVTKNIDAKLVILGDGPLREKLTDLIAELNLTDQVSLHGFCIDPYPWYRSADLFVLSSLWEGFGIVLVEALECGLQVVSTDCPSGPREILQNGKYGYLVPTSDPISLSGAIIKALQVPCDHALQKRRANDFTVDKISAEYLTLFFN